MLGIGTAQPPPPKQVGLVRACVHTAGVVEDFARIDAMREEFGARSLDIRDNQVQTLGGSGAAVVTFLPKMTEHPEPRGVNWMTRKSSPL